MQDQNTGLSYERRKVADLVLDPANARGHSERNLEAIKGSLARFGQQKPIVVDASNRVIAGNGTLLAARALGWDEIATVRSSLEGAEATAFGIADNRSAELAEWNDDVLARLLSDLDEEQRAAAGFSEKETAALAALSDELGEAMPGEDDAVTPKEGEAQTKEGDVWILGKHVLLCGNSTDATAWSRLNDAASAQKQPDPGGLLMITDPPWGVEYDPKWRLPRGSITSTGNVTNDDVANWLPTWVLAVECADVAYVWFGTPQEMKAQLREAGFDVRTILVWLKDLPVLSRGAYNSRKELCAYAVRKGSTARWCGDAKQQDVWQVDGKVGRRTITEGEDASTGHGTQKPVELFRRAILNHEHSAIVDPFCGSGSSIIAAEACGRVARAIEIDPNYCDAIVARFEAFTGTKAAKWQA